MDGGTFARAGGAAFARAGGAAFARAGGSTFVCARGITSVYPVEPIPLAAGFGLSFDGGFW
jgi:hypothetical protein